MTQLVLAVIFFFLVTFPTSTFAQYIYGAAAPAKQMMVDKKLLNPQNNQFVDNLSVEQHTFLSDQEVTFRVTVTNVTQSDLKNSQVTDKLPDVLNFVSTSFGNYDAKNKIINLTFENLKKGESKTIEIKAKVKGAAEIPTTVTCQSNLARVTVDNLVNEDTATLCVSKQVLGVSEALPVTGPSQTTGWLLLSTLSLAIGFLLKRIIFLEGR